MQILPLRAGVLLLLGSLLLGCDSSKPVVDQLSSGFDRVVENGESVQKATSEELEKLFSIEYKVIELSQQDSVEIEAKLAALGRDRWECFFIEPVNGARRFYFRRAPKTLLRYIPRVFF